MLGVGGGGEMWAFSRYFINERQIFIELNWWVERIYKRELGLVWDYDDEQNQGIISINIIVISKNNIEDINLISMLINYNY